VEITVVNGLLITAAFHFPLDSCVGQGRCIDRFKKKRKKKDECQDNTCEFSG